MKETPENLQAALKTVESELEAADGRQKALLDELLKLEKEKEVWQLKVADSGAYKRRLRKESYRIGAVFLLLALVLIGVAALIYMWSSVFPFFMLIPVGVCLIAFLLFPLIRSAGGRSLKRIKANDLAALSRVEKEVEAKREELEAVKAKLLEIREKLKDINDRIEVSAVKPTFKQKLISLKAQAAQSLSDLKVALRADLNELKSVFVK